MWGFLITSETITTVAAFGGLLLGIINLFLTIYKDFLRRGTPKLSVESAMLKYDGEGGYSVQLDLYISATGGDVYLKDIYIYHEVIGELNIGDRPSRLTILKLGKYVREDLLALDFGELYLKGKEMLATATDVRGLRISDKSLVSGTFVEIWNTPKTVIGWHKLPLEGWALEAHYRNTSVEVSFSFQEHPNSRSGGFN